MTEQKQERRVKVYCKNSVWLENAQARSVKVPAGMAVMLSADEIKHFGKKVTKDLPEEVEMYERD